MTSDAKKLNLAMDRAFENAAIDDTRQRLVTPNNACKNKNGRIMDDEKPPSAYARLRP
jgi:hypothetical protein